MQTWIYVGFLLKILSEFKICLSPWSVAWRSWATQWGQSPPSTDELPPGPHRQEIATAPLPIITENFPQAPLSTLNARDAIAVSRGV